MIDTSISRVKINEIIENQIPDFIVGENPEFVDFMRQYYISQEFQGGVIDIAESIQDYKSLDFLNNVNLTDNTQLSSTNVSQYDTTITVKSTKGWPGKYGLLKIDNEIITYTGITTNQFTGCIRGFSGIDQYHKPNDPQSLQFTSSVASFHAGLSTVTNLSSLFLQEFFTKTKKLFSPGFENRSFNENVNKSNFIRQAKDFYKSKGTEEAFKILFKVLYNQNVDLVKPQDFLIKPSAAKWDNKVVFVAKSDNDAGITTSLLIGKTLVQTSTNSSAPISGFDSIVEPDNTIFYKIFTNEENIIGNFKQNGHTKLVNSVAIGASVITVDSTVGFGTSGSLLINSEEVEYTNKSINQFFGCTGITTTSRPKEDVYSYDTVTVDDGNTTQAFRLTGILNTFVSDADAQKTGDYFGIERLGSNYQSNLFTTWLDNVSTRNNVVSVTSLGSNQWRLSTRTDHLLKSGDEILVIDTTTGAELDFTVSSIGGNRSVTILGGGTLQTVVNGRYYIRKKINFATSSLYTHLSKYTSKVQDIFSNESDVYVATSGLPQYEINASRRVRTFTNSGVTGISTLINLTNHEFYSGDLVVYTPSDSLKGASGLETGRTYCVKKNDGNSFYLAISPEAARKGQYVTVYGDVDKSSSGSRSYTLVPKDFYNKTIQPQHQIKYFPKNKSFVSPKQTIEPKNSVGLFLNGVELLTPKSDNKIYYGAIEKVNVLNGGLDYDIINKPRLNVSQTGHTGAGASVVPHVTGSITKLIVTNPGVDYLETPKLTVTGGNGKGFIGEIRLKSVHKKVLFDSSSTGGVVNTSTDTFTFTKPHELKNYEPVIYSSQGNTPIGINTTPSILTNDSTYYVIKQNDYSIQLANTLSDAQLGINPIGITTNGTGIHFLETVNRRLIVNEVAVVNGGYGYASHHVTTNPSGINTFTNTITIKNHGFNDADNVRYSPLGTSISGLNTTTDYYVRVIDNNNIQLSISTSLTSTVTLSSVGVGTHQFDHPPISVIIGGRQGITTSNATVSVEARGSITGVHIVNGQEGNGWGSLVINDLYRPDINIITGSDAVLRPVINNGQITSINVANGGKNYFSTPKVTVTGIGTGAEIVPTVLNGVITAATVVKPGIGYSDLSTSVNVITEGSGAIFSVDLSEWTINEVAKNWSFVKSDDGFAVSERADGKELPFISYYAPRKLREFVTDLTRDANGDEITETTHSKIIGWAYDGNPIYGPRGYSNPDGTGGISYMSPSYSQITGDRTNGPSLAQFPSGTFIEDYIYTEGLGKLDQYNGRFCITPDYPYGTYAYFTTVDTSVVSDSNDPFYGSRRPVYPYVIGSTLNNYANPENFTPELYQTDNLTDRNLIKNTYGYKVEEGYEFFKNINSNVDVAKIENLKTGIINNIEILDRGNDYNVGDKIEFTGGSGGFGALAIVESVSGVPISTITSSVTTLSNVVLQGERGKVTAISTSAPHGISDAEYIKISGISSTYYKKYEGTFRVKVGLTTSGLTTSIGTIAAQGKVVEVTIADSLNIFEVDDIIRIDHEEFKILNKDIDNNILRLERAQNGTTATSHNTGSLITRKEKKLSYIVDNLPSNFPDVDDIVYFNPSSSVGLGLTYGVGIGYSISYIESGGITTSFIPTKTIRLPNHPFKHGEKVGYSANGGSKIVISYDGSTTSTMPTDLYIQKISKDLVGLVTTQAGINSVSDRLFFSTVGVGSTHFFRSRRNVITASLTKVDVTVETTKNHNLKLNDQIQMNVVSTATSSIYPIYSSSTRKVSIGSSINPPLFVTKGDTLQFITTSTSLTDLVLRFYRDKNFTKRFVGSGTTNIEVTDGKALGITTIRFSQNTPTELYYRFESISASKAVDIDTTVEDYNKISVLNSKFAGKHFISSITSQTFKYNLFEIPERVGYSSDFVLRNYNSFSKSTIGPIASIKINDPGRNYKTLPEVSVASTTGTGCALKATSLDAEHIEKVDTFDYGRNYPSDYTLRPFANVANIITVGDSYKISSIGVVTSGAKYLSAPDLIIYNDETKTINNSASFKINMSGGSVHEINVINPGNNFSSANNRVISVNNTNGVGILTGSYTGGTVTLTLETPITGFTTSNPLPFAVGDKIFIENAVLNTGSGTGYNSSDYNYSYFTLTGVNTAFGLRNQATISYLNSSNPGILTTANQTGTVSNKNDLPTFTLNLEEASFIPGEIVTNGTVETRVTKSNTNYVRNIGIKNLVGINTGNYLLGKTSNAKGIIKNINDNTGYYTIGVSKKTSNDWLTDTGKTNMFFERVSDNDYYQNFSYSLKSRVGISSWDEPVDSLAHITGFKKFSDLLIPSDSLGISTSLEPVALSTDRTVFIDNSAQLFVRNDYDLVYEKLKNNNTISDQVVFNSTKFGDSVKIVGSRAYPFDDISPEFFSETIKYPDAFIEIDRVNTVGVPTARSVKYHISVKVSGTAGLSTDNTKYGELIVTFDENNIYSSTYSDLIESLDIGDIEVIEDISYASIRFVPYNPFFDYFIGTYKETIDGIVGVGSTSYGNTTKIGITSTISAASPSTSHVFGRFNTSDYRSGTSVFAGLSTNGIVQVKEITFLGVGVTAFQVAYSDINSGSSIGTCFIDMNGSSEILPTFIPNAGLGVTMSVFTTAVGVASTAPSSGISSISLGDTDLMTSRISIGASGSPSISSITSATSLHYSTTKHHVEVHNETDDQYSCFIITTSAFNTGVNVNKYNSISTNETEPSRDMDNTTVQYAGDKNVIINFLPKANKAYTVRTSSIRIITPDDAGSDTTLDL